MREIIRASMESCIMLNRWVTKCEMDTLLMRYLAVVEKLEKRAMVEA